jgi:hypothetical protein
MGLVDRATGQSDNLTVLSVNIPRETESRLNWQTVDASDSMKNFTHMMGFRRGEGFSPVERINAVMDQGQNAAKLRFRTLP